MPTSFYMCKGAFTLAKFCGKNGPASIVNSVAMYEAHLTLCNGTRVQISHNKITTKLFIIMHFKAMNLASMLVLTFICECKQGGLLNVGTIL